MTGFDAVFKTKILEDVLALRLLRTKVRHYKETLAVPIDIALLHTKFRPHS
jgi:hypothetical protein